jgi:hypothetical protein
MNVARMSASDIRVAKVPHIASLMRATRYSKSFAGEAALMKRDCIAWAGAGWCAADACKCGRYAGL